MFQVGRKRGTLRTEILSAQKESFFFISIMCILLLPDRLLHSFNIFLSVIPMVFVFESCRHQLAPAGSFAYATSGGQFVCHRCASYRSPGQEKSWPNACCVGQGLASGIPSLPELVQSAWHPSIEFALQLEPVYKGLLEIYA